MQRAPLDRFLAGARRLLTRSPGGRTHAGSPAFGPVRSQPCTHAQALSLDYQLWAARIGARPLLHRAQWEWLYVLQALAQEGAIGPGARGLGLGSSDDPIAAHLDRQGCTVVVADALPSDASDFDFVWSTGVVDHLGDIEAGLRFVEESLAVVRRGGVAVHTATFNVSSNLLTPRRGPAVAFRRRDIERLQRRLRAQGHVIDCTFALGDLPGDGYVDHEPFTTMHLRTALGRYAITSYGLLVRKVGAP